MHFIVAYDASRQSKSALEYAIRLGKQTGANITALHSIRQQVKENPNGAGNPVVEGISEAEARCQRVLKNADDHAENHDFAIETDVAYGEPIRGLIEYAENRNADSIIVGHRGQAGKRPGSVTRGLLEQSEIPVTAVSKKVPK